MDGSRPELASKGFSPGLKESVLYQARQEFVHELGPSVRLNKQAKEFQRVMSQYRTTLNTVVDGTLSSDVVQTARELTSLHSGQGRERLSDQEVAEKTQRNRQH